VNATPLLPITAAPRLQAAVGERDVGRDDDVARSGTLGDPVVRGVETVAHHHQFDRGSRGTPR